MKKWDKVIEEEKVMAEVINVKKRVAKNEYHLEFKIGPNDRHKLIYYRENLGYSN
jgi:hypothetical protein